MLIVLKELKQNKTKQQQQQQQNPNKNKRKSAKNIKLSTHSPIKQANKQRNKEIKNSVSLIRSQWQPVQQLSA